MIEEMYNQIVLQLEYEGIKGSGVLYQPEGEEYSYLITAGHCIYGDEKTSENICYDNLKIYRQIGNLIESCNYLVKDHIWNEHLDIIIFKMAYITALERYKTINLNKKQDVVICGYPKALQESECKHKRYCLHGTVNENYDGCIVIDSNRRLDTISSDAKDTISGYSGSGIFIELNNELFVAGIITDLADPNGSFDAVCGVDIIEIQETIKQNGWLPLISAESESFDMYKDSVREICEGDMLTICLAQMKDIRSNVKPKDIIEYCGKKLVWPYSEVKLNTKIVWQKWLIYLMLRCIEDKNNMCDNNFYLGESEKGIRKIKVIYSSEKYVLNEFLKDYLSVATNDVNDRDFIVLTTDKEPMNQRLSSKKINSIVMDVSSAVSSEQEILIDEVSIAKDISLIHINKILHELQTVIQEIEDNDQNISQSELKRILGERIGEIWNEF